MIFDIQNLNQEDKIYIINNINSFSLSSKMLFNNEATKLYYGISSSDIDRGKSQTDFVYNKANDFILKIYGISPSSNEYCRLKEFNGMIKSQQCETIDGIRELLVSFFLKVVDVQKSMKIPVNMNEYIQYMLTVVFPWKIRAYEIVNMAAVNVNNIEKGYISFQLGMLSINGGTNEYLTTSLYLLYKALCFNDVNFFIPVIKSMCMYHVKNYDEIFKMFKDVIDNNVSISEVIDNVNDKYAFIKPTKSEFNQFVIDNYNKNQIANSLKLGLLCVGDNIFDKSEDINYLYIQLDHLDADEVKRYIDEGSQITFNIPQRYLGYLRVRESVKLCKVMLRDTTSRTMITYDDVNYMLFMKSGDTKLYGLSFPEEYDGERKMISFEISDKIDYNVQ